MQALDLLTGGRRNQDHVSPDHRLREGGTLMRPSPSLLRSLAIRLALAGLIIVIVTLSVYFGRDGFVDNSHPGETLSFVDSICPLAGRHNAACGEAASMCRTPAENPVPA